MLKHYDNATLVNIQLNRITVFASYVLIYCENSKDDQESKTTHKKNESVCYIKAK